MPPNSTHQCKPSLIVPLIDENYWNPTLRGTLYFLALIYSFVGISVVTDIFMGAVIVITSKTKKLYLLKSEMTKRDQAGNSVSRSREHQHNYIEVRVWNDTVANLTLLALGTSAPEILLACIEVVGHNFEAGELGPGTIVGSAAFNLLMITAICMLSIPKGQSRKIRMFNVFLLCSTVGILAYIWLWLVLTLISPDVVELWEAIATFLMFPLLVFLAYLTDKGWVDFCPFLKGKKRLEREKKQEEEAEKLFLENQFFKDGKIDREGLITFMRALKKYPDLSPEDAALLAASKINEVQPRSSMHYRIGAVRELTGGKKTQPMLSRKLKDIYDSINQHNFLPRRSHTSVDNSAIVEFHAASCAVSESIGSFYVTIWRHGNLKTKVTVHVRSVDGSARVTEDYVKVDNYVTFEPDETEKSILVQIVNDTNWEPDEEFYLKLSLVEDEEETVRLGKTNVMEVRILDDDNPGEISFDKKGVLVRESSDTALITVRRKNGAAGEVKVFWRTLNDTAISGRDFVGGEGTLLFKHGEVSKILEIPIICGLKLTKDKSFEVELRDPSGNASLGNVNRTFVTILNDEAFSHIIEKFMTMTSENLESFSVYRKTWATQLREAVTVNGGDLINASLSDYIMHVISFYWKVIFSIIPPPMFWGGWLCFFVSLTVIGLVTAIIGDIASAFGCAVGLRDPITAITLVAFGTSLPDTFASRSAALREAFADTSIGNITGSNSVNVFLGLGLPWMIASLYHTFHGTEFHVPTNTLGFSVLVFFCVALLANVLLIFRRHAQWAGKAELGGPMVCKLLSGVFLIGMWLFYVMISCFKEYGIISVYF